MPAAARAPAPRCPPPHPRGGAHLGRVVHRARTLRRPARMLFRRIATIVLALGAAVARPSSASAQPADSASSVLLRPDRVFDGERMHEGWAVLVRGTRIAAA